VNDNLGCMACGLSESCQHPRMMPDEVPGSVPGACDIMYIGEAPGCVVGNTLIEVAYRDKSKYPNGIPIVDLVGKNDFYVYSYDLETNGMVLGKVARVWKTGKKKVYTVTYEWKYPNGDDLVYVEDSITVTSNHKFLLKPKLKHDPFKGLDYGNVCYVSIDDGLCVGASLQPFHRSNVGYSYIGISAKSMLLEARFLLGNKVGRPMTNKENCHHIDRNTLNDSWDNLELHTISSHAALHMREDGSMLSPDAIAKHKAVVQSDAYRKRHSEIMKEVLSNPKVYAERLQQIEACRGKIQATVKKRFTEPGFYYKYLLGVQKVHNLSHSWLVRRFKGKFPNEPFPVDNHKIVSIVCVGIEDVYDIEVDTYHNFAAHGIFVHNSEEDTVGVPFVGRSGQLLRDAVDDAGLKGYNHVYTNVVHCRPPENKTPTNRQIQYCLSTLMDELEHYKPRVVVLLGNVPLKAVLGETGITNWRGTFIQRDGMTIVPTFHPAYILRNQQAIKEWIDDFDKIAEYLDGNDNVARADVGYKLEIVQTARDAEMMYNAIAATGMCSWDTEDNGLQFGDEVVLMSFAIDNPKMAWAVPIDNNYATLQYCKRILEDPKILKIGHNIKFDTLIVGGNLGISICGTTGDSMLLSYILDPVPGRHGLKPLAGRYLGMYDYASDMEAYLKDHKEADPSRGGNLRLVPMEILAKYAQLDAVATWELHKRLYVDLNDQQRALYTQMIMPANVALETIEANGVKLDQHIVGRYCQIYHKTQQDQLYSMLQDKHVVAYSKRKAKSNPKFSFNPNSPVQMREILFGSKYYGLEPGGLTNTGQPSTSWSVLSDYQSDVPFLKAYRYYKLLGKMLSTYLVPARDRWPGVDGRVHATYLLHGTETGRLSSKEPNMQNIPTPEKEPGTLLADLPVKNIFTHTWEGGCLLAVDYSGMELRTMASVSHCKGMADIFAQGIDLHSVVTEYLFNVKRDDFTPEQWKPMRYRAKWTNWTLLYGGSWHTLHRLYGIDENDAQRMVARYYELFPEVLEYREDTIAFVKEHGYVESPFGRRRYLPHINDSDEVKRNGDERAAINMPIQSAASDILLCALIIISQQMAANEFKSLMVNTVHDSLLFDVYPGELDDLAWLAKETMENLPNLYGPNYMLDIDFSWFTVPLKVDLEFGSHYGSLEEYEVQE